MEQLVFIEGDLGDAVVGSPSRHQGLCQLTTGLYEEGCRTYCGIQHLESQDLDRGWVGPQELKDGLQGLPDDGAGERPRRVMGSRSAPFRTGLEDHGALGDDPRGGISIDLAIQSCGQALHGGGPLEGFQNLPGELLVCGLLQPLFPFTCSHPKQGLQVDGNRGTMGLLGSDGEGGTFCQLQGEAHHGLIDGADLLHIQGSVGEALAVEE